MSASKIELLRLALPPSHALGTSPMRGSWRAAEGLWHSAQFDTLAEITTRYQPQRLEVCPHPSELSMTEAELPPLSPQRLRLAVHGVVELLALLPPDELAIGFGRHSSGKLPIAWMSQACLRQIQHLLQQHGLYADAVLPLPALLPAPQKSPPAPAATAMLLDDWVVMRTGPDTGVLHPLPRQSSSTDLIEPRLRPLLAHAGPIQWLHHDPAQSEPWCGSDWDWRLPSAHAESQSPPWSGLRPAWAWTALATVVWLTGLHLHARHTAAQGQALKQQMAAQVRAAFPELPIVLHPLQQARQLRDARRSGTATAATPDFGSLLRASTALLTQSAAQVQRVDYRDGQIEIHWRDGAALQSAELEVLRAKAREKGLWLESDAQAIRLRASPPGPHTPATQPEPAS